MEASRNAGFHAEWYLGDPASLDTPRLGEEVEITQIPSLTDAESNLLNAHSILNGFNALVGELSLLGVSLMDDEDHLRPALDTCERMLQAIRNKDDAVAEAVKMAEHATTILGNLDQVLAAHASFRMLPEVVRSETNIRHVIDVLSVRAAEFLCHARTPDVWVAVTPGELRESLTAFFSAVERNARGRYRIVYHPAVQGAGDYYIDMRLGDGLTPIRMPGLLRDVIRDLAANARKFTSPGGIVTIGVTNHGGCVDLVVVDNGRGIPASEIPAVVHFGERGSNVFDVRTYGGGFGLTKAFLVAKRFGGRFWIASQLGVGTRIRISIPMPQTV